MMKVLLCVLAVSFLALIETKSIEDNTRNCIVKYLSDKKLLDSSFVVDSMLPENCFELIDDKLEELYIASYYKDNDDNETNGEFIDFLQMTDMVDLILKSNLIGDTKRAKELSNVFEELIKIDKFIEPFAKNTNENYNFKTLHSTGETSCLQSYFSELLKNETQDAIKIPTIEGCEEILTSLKKSFEKDFLAMLPKLSSEEGQNCVLNAYKKLNMTNNFFNGFYVSKIMQDENMNFTLIGSYIFQFYVPITQCVRLITKENNVFMIEVDFNEVLNITVPEDNMEKYRKTQGIIVKLNEDNSQYDFHLIANETSEVMKYSKCFVDELNQYNLGPIAARIRFFEREFEVVDLVELKDFFKDVFKQCLDFCEPDYYSYFSRMKELQPGKMECFRQFVTTEDVDGVTFYRVNMNLRADDVKCNFYYKMDGNYDDFSECVSRKAKSIDFSKRLWSIQALSQYNLSSQQQNEFIISRTELEIEWNSLKIDCYLDEFYEM